MSLPLCFETICVQERKLVNLSYHEARLNKTRRALYGFQDDWDLSKLLTVPDYVTNEPHKCRLTYGENIEEIKWEPYHFRTIKKIQRVYIDEVDYSYKYNDRTALNNLYEQRKDAEEILIIKNGMVTDSLYCNVAFLKDGRWFTPDTPLLAGTQRAFLLDSGIIEEAPIPESDISQYSRIRLFNAMVNWENSTILERQVIQ
ncbi:aminotransferase class IV [Dyadobacter sp. CY356]|uniref:aminotransferase class IV n=1 Tax=Dyadobacter sp. CY356 TaxID=2906442 RepID=UPI001F1C882F|nr:aminotransferase class IV [Dyadobacter sp. CY356]MCF0056732.1 aminotransferase class IV [Dyadobacter sp. CY356]